MANEPNSRGEVTIDLDATYVMRPSYEAIEEIESQTNRGIVALVNMAAQGELKLGDAAIIVTECIKSWGKQQVAEGNATPITRSAAGANVKKVASLIHEGGIVRATERCAIVLMAAATGGVTSSGEWKPATETETAIPDAG
jgi:hypothetical protein